MNRLMNMQAGPRAERSRLNLIIVCLVSSPHGSCVVWAMCAEVGGPWPSITHPSFNGGGGIWRLLHPYHHQEDCFLSVLWLVGVEASVVRS